MRSSLKAFSLRRRCNSSATPSKKVLTSTGSSPRKRRRNSRCVISIGVSSMPISSPPDAAGQVVEGVHDHHPHHLNADEDENGRKVDAHGTGEQPARGLEYRFRGAIQKLHEGIPRVGVDPRDDGAGNNDPEVNPEKRVQDVRKRPHHVGEDEHPTPPDVSQPTQYRSWTAPGRARANYWPNSGARRVAASTAAISVPRTPACSKT